jgi:thiol:disulfide interchange protein DsbD
MGGGQLLAHGWLWAFATVFVGGFLTSLTPCVYPMISITVSLFGAREDGSTRGRAMALAALYVAGIAVMYSALGVSFALAGRAFGTFMASPYVMVPLAVFFLAMAASMFGAFDLALPTELQHKLTSVGGKGFGGAFAMGLVGGIIAAPCTGPVLASVLAYVATTRSVFMGGSLLFTYALGMGVLFFVIAAFAVSMPRSGGWMDAVKSLFGVVMVVAALYFLRNVSPALSRYGAHTMAWLASHGALVAIGLGLGALHLSFKWSSRGEKLRKGLGVAALVVGAYGIVGYLLTAPQIGAELHWVRGEAAGVQAARLEHKPVLLDFYADWCLPCKELELKTFSDPKVKEALAGFTLVKVDCTADDDPAVVDAKQRYHADTLPTLSLLDADGHQVKTINHFVEPTELIETLRAL